MAARASNILVCWERRTTRDSLQMRAGTAAPSCSSFEGFHCLNLSNFKRVKLIFRMKRVCVSRACSVFRLEYLSAAALQGERGEVRVKKDGPCSHLSVGSCTQQATTGVTHQLCSLTRQHMWRHTHTHTITSTDNMYVCTDVMNESCSACP